MASGQNFKLSEFMEENAIGSIHAIISGIRTLKDGSFELRFEVNPDDQQVVSKLMQMYALNERLVAIGIVKADQ